MFFEKVSTQIVLVRSPKCGMQWCLLYQRHTAVHFGPSLWWQMHRVLDAMTDPGGDGAGLVNSLIPLGFIRELALTVGTHMDTQLATTMSP